MNETLLNLGLLQNQFDQYFSDKHALKYWFTKLLHSSTIMGIMGEYKSFGELAAVALEGLFYENQIPLSDDVKEEILGAFRSLPAYDDVPPALQLLREKQIRAIALSNSSLPMITEQLSNAGVVDLFDACYSVDMAAQYKPFKEVYSSTAASEGLAISEVAMVATHDWDLFGAKRAGLRTGYVPRKVSIYHPLYAQPDYQAATLPELLARMIADG